jgi:hypothetical protein
MNEEQIPQNHAAGINDRNDAQSETAQLPVTNESVELLPEELAAQEENAQPITADSLAAPLPSDVPSAPAESVEQPVMNEPVSGSDASAVSFQDSDEAVLSESRGGTRVAPSSSPERVLQRPQALPPGSTPVCVNRRSLHSYVVLFKQTPPLHERWVPMPLLRQPTLWHVQKTCASMETLDSNSNLFPRVGACNSWACVML